MTYDTQALTSITHMTTIATIATITNVATITSHHLSSPLVTGIILSLASPIIHKLSALVLEC